MIYYFFFFNDTATTEIYTLSLHDALPILPPLVVVALAAAAVPWAKAGIEPILQHKEDAREAGFYPVDPIYPFFRDRRSEEHTSELQSRQYLVCRLLLEKKKTQTSASEHLS